jgi:putative endonuclease
MAAHNIVGETGEKIAVEYLEKLGYRILERNWRYRRSEVDIIAMLDDVLVFVEVKTRSTDLFGAPELSFSERKEQLLISALGAYMRKIGHDWAYRIDLISIVLHGEAIQSLQHFENAVH